jgi:hypothetical protein
MFLERYLARHLTDVSMIAMVQQLSNGSPQSIIAVIEPASGLAAGCLIGVFAIVAGLMRQPRQVELASGPESYYHRPVCIIDHEPDRSPSRATGIP